MGVRLASIYLFLIRSNQPVSNDAIINSKQKYVGNSKKDSLNPRLTIRQHPMKYQMKCACTKSKYFMEHMSKMKATAVCQLGNTSSRTITEIKQR